MLGAFFVTCCKKNKFPFWELIIIFEKNYNLRVIAKKTLRDFWLKHAECEQQLKSWYRETERANWNTINELKEHYPSASILSENRII